MAKNDMQMNVTFSAPGADSAPAAAASRRVSAFDLVAGTPWAIEPAMLDTIRAISLRENDSVEALEAKMGRPLQNARNVSMRDGVAVVPITGPIFRYANLMTQISGATSLEVLAKDFRAAIDDPQVGAIVLDINSPGGQVTGIAEFAQMVHESGKPVVAYVDGMAASAAYWIAAAAGQVVMSKNAVAGNVGAVLTLDTRSSANTLEIVSSQSPNKRPDVTTDAGRAQIQTMVDAHAQVFIEEVAAFRGITPQAVISDWNGGEVFIASKAVSLGMADKVSTLEEVIAGLSGKTPMKGMSMTASSGTPAAEKPVITREYLAQHHADLVSALLDEGRIIGATAERERIQSVEAQAIPGHEALIAALKFDGKTSGPEAAVAVLSAEKNKLGHALASSRADAPAPATHATAPADANPAAEDTSLPLEARCQAQWDSSPQIRAEFREFGNFVAYTKASEAGNVRVLGARA